jgi:hypothetical protein
MIVTKTTIGFVTQRYDTRKKRFLDQEFHAADDVTWEKKNGDSIELKEKSRLGLGDNDTIEPYLNFEMIQPAKHNFKIGDRVDAYPDIDDDWNEFWGVVQMFRDNGNLITIKDGDGDCFDCRPGQLKHA